MGSRSFSDARKGARLGLVVGLVTALAVAATGCVTVEPQDKEYLADPAMTFGSEGSLGSQAEHVRNNREGSFGGGSTTGGGCGCN